MGHQWVDSPININKPILIIGILLFGITIHPTLIYLWRVYFEMPLENQSFPVFLLSVFFFIRSLKKIKADEIAMGSHGIKAVFGALLLYQISLLIDINLLSSLCAAAFFGALFYFFFGWLAFKQIVFSLFLFTLSLPLTSIFDLWFGFEVRLLGTQVAFWILSWSGIAREVLGVNILLQNNILSIDEACSGLKSLSVMLVLTLIMGHLFYAENILKRAVLVLAGILVAGISNCIRIVILGGIVHFGDVETAMGVLHSWSGAIIYSISLLTLWGVHEILRQ